MSAFDDDLELLYSADAPDITAATFTVSGTPATVYGYYNRPGSTLDFEGMQVVTTEPTFECNAADVPSFNKTTDTITISSVEFRVLRWQASTDGRVMLYYLRA